MKARSMILGALNVANWQVDQGRSPKVALAQVMFSVLGVVGAWVWPTSAAMGLQLHLDDAPAMNRPDWVATAETQLIPPGPAAFLEEFPSFNSQLLDQQLQVYAEYLWSEGPPDVLIVGSSRALQGVDPGVLQETLVQQGYPPLRVYNFSINGATAQVVDLMVRRLLATDQLPRLVIWADGSRAFNNGRVDVTYNGITASQGYQRLLAGDRPIPSLPPLEIYANEAEQCLPPTQLATGVALPLPCTTTLPLAEWNTSPVTRSLAAASLRPATLELDPKGFRTVTDQYDPTRYYQRFPRVAGRYDSNYAGFELGGAQTASTQALAQYLRDRQIPLVFVSLPLNRDYIDSYRQAREQEFRQYLAQLASQGGFGFRDLSQQWSTQHQYFADPSHLNVQGARAVARHLAGDRTIPWHRLAGGSMAQP